MIPFNFDIILIMIFITFALIGAISGLKSQIPITLNIIVPFLFIYFFGKFITKLLFNFPIYRNIMDAIFGGALFQQIDFTLKMAVAYILMYLIIFLFVRILYGIFKGYSKRSNIKKKSILSNILGFGLALINAYVAIFFIILPLLFLGVVDSTRPLTSIMVNNPPFFSRLGATTKAAVPVYDTVDQATEFMDILTSKNFDEYFNYISNSQQITSELETDFMDNKYDLLSEESKTLINNIKPSELDFNTDPSGLARTLLELNPETNNKVYEDILAIETENQSTILEQLEEQFSIISKYEGLIIWYMDELGGDTIPSYDGETSITDIGTVIQSFKENYEDIVANTSDEALLYQLELAKTSIDSYEIFSLWISCTEDNIINNITPDDPNFVCDTIDVSLIESDPSLVNNYDFASQSAYILAFVLDGDNLSNIMLQYKYDYEAGVFSDVFDFEEHPKIESALIKSYELVTAYEEHYKQVVETLDPSIDFKIRLAISVAKAKFDIYNQMEETPLFAAFVNDAAMMCMSQSVPAYENNSIDVCREGFLKTSAEVIMNVYLFRDENNDMKTYSATDMEELLDGLNDGIKDTVLTEEFVKALSYQIAFTNDLEEEALLERYYREGYITEGALDVLIANELGIFDDIFVTRVTEIKTTVTPDE